MVYDTWVQRGLVFADGSGREHYREEDINLTVTPAMVNDRNESVFATIFMTIEGASRWEGDKGLGGEGIFDDRKSLSRVVELMRYKRKRVKAKKKEARSLLGGRGDDEKEHVDGREIGEMKGADGQTPSSSSSSSSSNDEDNEFYYAKSFMPELTLSSIPGINQEFPRGGIPPQMMTSGDFTFYEGDGGRSGAYYPVLYNNEFWMTSEKMIAINSTLIGREIPLKLSYNTLSMWKWQMMTSMEKQWESQANMNSMLKMGGDDDDDVSKKESDMMRNLLMDTNPVLLVVTAVVSCLHSLFDMLAFKNDIKFFKNKKSMAGISLRTMVVNLFFQGVVFLYLVDNDTSFMILVSNGVGLAIEVWKLTRAVKFGFEDGKIVWTEAETYKNSKTKEFDEIATNHLLYITAPLMIGYSIYSLVNLKHKGWYSWILSSIVGFIYMFGFVMMTPQLFINYKLKSVAHLNWRTMTYKSLNTFIDDLFAFVVKMPLMHRLSCFRDDIIFFIFLYQRWIYRVDFTRVNEFGQCEEPTAEEIEDQEKLKSEEISSTSTKMRRSARDRRQDDNDDNDDIDNKKSSNDID